MNILAFDTSSDTLCVVLGKDQKILASYESLPGSRQAESLTSQIEQVLKKSKMSLGSVDVIVVGVGPGSFTGLRVGVACAQSLAFALKTPLASFCSLDAIARNLGKRKDDIVVALDAKRSQVYAAIYRWSGEKILRLKKPAIYPASMIDSLARKKGGGSVVVPPEDTRPKAAGVYACALEAARLKKFVKPANLLPLYLHPKDCNVNRKK